MTEHLFFFFLMSDVKDTTSFTIGLQTGMLPII